jgi:hypothetical protein
MLPRRRFAGKKGLDNGARIEKITITCRHDSIRRGRAPPARRLKHIGESNYVV